MIYLLKQNYMGVAVSAGVFFVFLVGCLFIYGKDFLDQIERMKAYDRLKSTTINDKNTKTFTTKIDKSLGQMLLALNAKKVDVQKLKHLTIGIFAFTFVVSSYVISPFAGFFISLFFASLPILLLRLKLDILQTKGSHEGEALIVALLSRYRTCSFNIEEAIEKVVKDENLLVPTSKTALYRLLYNVRGTKNPVLIRESTNLFAYTMGTNWGKMLANNIYLAIIGGTNVSMPIEDILVRLREAGSLQEERRRKNSESVRIVKYVAPVIYLLFFLLSVQFVGISVQRYLYNQFMTKQGLLLFSLNVVFWIINYCLVTLVNNKKFDF